MLEERKRRKAKERMERIQTAKARREQEQKVEKERAKKEAEERQTKEQLEANKATDADLKLLEEKNRQAARDTAMQLRKQSSGDQNSQSQALDIKLRDARKEADSLKRKSCDSSAGHSQQSGTITDTVAGTSQLNLPAGYRAVRCSKLSSLAVRPLEGGSAIPFVPIGGFANEYDKRIMNAHTSVNSNAHWNISSSFDIGTLTCKTCTHKGEHSILGRKSAGSDGTEQAPPCFVQSDQNFPPLVPAEGEGDCLKIIQIENASLSDLSKAFLGVVEGFTMPSGTVVVICSVSHLAAVGTAVYAEDLVRAFRTLRGAYGTGISVMPGFPILISGLNNKNTIRELLEVNHWYNLICKSGTKEIPETRTLCYSTLIKDDTASSTSAPEVRPLMLPQNLTSYDKVSFESKGFGNQNDLCLPISVLEESKLISSMVRELNKNAGLDLASDMLISRDGSCTFDEEPDLLKRERIIFMGSSHGSRISDEMSSNFEVIDLTNPGWTITEKGVDELVEILKEQLENADESRTTIVYQLFDNSSFWVRKEDGSRIFPEKGEDRVYHVDGKLEVADREDAKRMVSLVTRLLRAGRMCRKLVLSSLPRWMYEACCNLPSHCLNIADENYVDWMGERLSDLRHYINEHVKMKGIKRVYVVQPALLLNGDSSTHWDDDPIHMTPEGYSKLAHSLENLVVKMAEDEEGGALLLRSLSRTEAWLVLTG